MMVMYVDGDINLLDLYWLINQTMMKKWLNITSLMIFIVWLGMELMRYYIVDKRKGKYMYGILKQTLKHNYQVKEEWVDIQML